MTSREWLTSLLVPSMAGVAGYAVGYPARKMVMWGIVVCALPVGFFYGLRNSARRLQGRAENLDEVRYYKYRLDTYPFQVRVEPLRQLIDEELEEIEDTARW